MKPFTDIVNSLRYGHLSDELTRQLHQLTLEFVAEGGALVREDPRQTRLDLRTVDPDTGEIRQVNTAAT